LVFVILFIKKIAGYRRKIGCKHKLKFDEKTEGILITGNNVHLKSDSISKSVLCIEML